MQPQREKREDRELSEADEALKSKPPLLPEQLLAMLCDPASEREREVFIFTGIKTPS